MIVPQVIGVFVVDAVVPSTDELRQLVGETFSLVGAEKVVFLLEPEIVEGNAVARPGLAWFVANPDAPPPTESTFSFTSTAAVAKFEATITGSDVQLTQAFLALKLSSGTNAGRWRGRITVILYSKGLHVGEIDIAIPPDLSATDRTIFPVGRVPADGLSHLRAGLYGTGFTASRVKWQLMVRGIEDTNSPGGWIKADSASSATSFTSTSPNVCSDNVPVNNLTQANYGWIEVGVSLNLDNTGSGGPTGNLHVVVGGIYDSATVPVPRVIGVFPFNVPCRSTTAEASLTGPPFALTGGVSVRALVEYSSVGTNAEVMPALNTYAATPDGTDPTVFSVGSYTGAAAEVYGQDVTSDLDFYLAQAGLSHRLSTAGNTVPYIGTLTVFLYASQLPVGELRIEVPTGLTGNSTYYVVGRIPAVGADALRLALVGDGLTASSVKWELWIRGVNDTTAPGNWYKANSTSSPTEITDTTVNTGKRVAISPSGLTVNDHAWLDVAIALTVGTNTPTGGRLKVSMAASYA